MNIEIKVYFYANDLYKAHTSNSIFVQIIDQTSFPQRLITTTIEAVITTGKLYKIGHKKAITVEKLMSIPLEPQLIKQIFVSHPSRQARVNPTRSSFSASTRYQRGKDSFKAGNAMFE